jgi:hypothetical protein
LNHISYFWIWNLLFSNWSFINCIVHSIFVTSIPLSKLILYFFLIATCIWFNLAFVFQTSCLDNRVLQFFVLRFDICSHLYQVVVEKKLMRERKLTRHDIGREKFVSEVSTSFAWHMIICGPTVSLSVILPLIMDSVSAVVLKHHNYCHVLKWMCCLPFLIP